MHFIIFSEPFQILLQNVLGLFGFLVFGPFLAVILMFLYIYRRLVEIVLKIQLRNKFVGLVESSDAIWCVEDMSLSIITSVIILKKPTGSTNTFFLKNIRKLFNHLSKTVPTELEKLFYYRYQKYGYFYWEKSHKFDPETAIRWLECEISNCDGSCENAYSTTFQENLGFICNKPLYDNHKSMWEILIGRRCRKSSSYIKEDPNLSAEDRFNTDVDEIPIVFRYHHSLGDGIALLQMLNTVIADEGMIKEQSTIMELKNSISTAKENSSKREKRFFSKIILKVKQVYNKTKEMIPILFSLKLVISAIVRSRSKSALHGQSLTGEKLIVCLMENDAYKSQLLMKIKKIRHCTGAKFNDIILTAFAAGLIRYYSRIKEEISDAISVFIPIRMFVSDKTNANVMLKNGYSFLLIKNCFVNADKKDILTLNKTCRFFERLQKTASINNKIRKSLEAPVNFFLLQYVFGLLPEKVLRYCTFCCTMALSNIKGMQSKIHILKHPVKNFLFLIQNRNTIGLGLTVMTYDNKLHLSLTVDKAIIRDRKLITEIMEETVREINSAYNILA